MKMKTNYIPQLITFEMAIADTRKYPRSLGLFYYHTPYGGENNIWIAYINVGWFSNWSSFETEQCCIEWLINDQQRLNDLL